MKRLFLYAFEPVILLQPAKIAVCKDNLRHKACISSDMKNSASLWHGNCLEETKSMFKVKFMYNTETGKFIEAAAFAACKRRPKGTWVEVELTDAQAAEVLRLEVKAESYERKFKRRETKETSSDALYDEHDWEAVDSAVDIQAEVEEADAIEQLIAPLSQERRELVLLYYRDGFTLAEIGRHFGISESAAKRRLDTAIGQLKKR